MSVSVAFDTTRSVGASSECEVPSPMCFPQEFAMVLSLLEERYCTVRLPLRSFLFVLGFVSWYSVLRTKV